MGPQNFTEYPSLFLHRLMIAKKQGGPTETPKRRFLYQPSISLTCSYRLLSTFEMNEFIVQENPIPSLDCDQRYKYLDVTIDLIHDPDSIF